MDVSQLNVMFHVILLGMIKLAQATATTCSPKFTTLAKSCMDDVEHEFSLSVSKILAKDSQGTRELCRKYQEMYYCLHSVLDPCSTLGEHYFSVIKRRMVSHYGQHCPGVSPDDRRTTPLPTILYHVTTNTKQSNPDVPSGKMNRRLKSDANVLSLGAFINVLCVLIIFIIKAGVVS